MQKMSQTGDNSIFDYRVYPAQVGGSLGINNKVHPPHPSLLLLPLLLLGGLFISTDTCRRPLFVLVNKLHSPQSVRVTFSSFSVAAVAYIQYSVALYTV